MFQNVMVTYEGSKEGVLEGFLMLGHGLHIGLWIALNRGSIIYLKNEDSSPLHSLNMRLIDLRGSCDLRILKFEGP